MKKKLTLALCLCTLIANVPTMAASNTAVLTYTFSGASSAKAGYAEGTISFTAENAGTYYLYWANDTTALKDYYPITHFSLKTDETGTFTFGNHTAIPAEATKLIVIKSDQEPTHTISVTDAASVFNIPSTKQLPYKDDDALYTFNSYSDIHIDEEHWGETPAYWWQFSEDHFSKALKYATNKNVDFIVSSGDQVTHASFDTLDKEWKAYQYILSQSDYVHPIWESSGNHEVRQDAHVADGLQAFIKGTGLDSNLSTLKSNKPYYALTEPTTGDLFIFMALEGGYRPAQYDEFSNEQLDWLENLLELNYTRGKNIYLIQHALISKYGAGDDTENPYYGGSINPDLESTKRFVSIIEKYPNIIWISGHTHEDFSLGYNYSNNNGTSCHMIHNSSVGNPTLLNPNGEHSLDYTFNENNAKGYYVQTFKNAILFNGANLCDEKIYPAYCYIIDGKTSKLENPATQDQYPLTKDVITSGTLNSTLSNAQTVLGIYYQYSSYDQYQLLKKNYYEYKDVDTTTMTDQDRQIAYSKLSYYISKLHSIVTAS